jgi:DNA-binding SARP family transcriptional activator/class 3 adenylate cyclase
LEFHVLGPLEAVHDGESVSVGGSRERAVLARLLLSANQVVSLEALADDLWHGAPPEGAAEALWVYVSRLRKALRAHGGDEALVTRPPGYVLRVEPGDVDSARFEALVARARQLAAADDHGAAAATLRKALALWRGPALADVADVPFAQAEAARLEEARLGAFEERIEADLACGRHGELIGELSGLTRDHPLRERLWAQRMLALYRAGRQAEALRAYQDLRRHLGEELGIEPSEALRHLETAILRHEPELDWRPGGVQGGPAPVPPVAEAAEESVPAGGVVSFLFTDLVGSTELLTRLGDEAADELRRRHFALLRQALSAHGGTEVKSLGDGFMAAFGSPLAALRCAVAIQRAMDEHAREPGPPLAVRVGLHAGEPIEDGDDYFGTPVVVAQRLCARARGNQILASALIQGLVGNRADCSFKELGGLALKGLAQPVATCEVIWDTGADAALPLPLPIERQESSAFVGREAEMTRLEAAWEAARSGQRQVVLVAGEPGIGKTRLAAEIARSAHAGGAAVLFGRCDEGMGMPYQPVVEALGAYLRRARAPVLGRLAGELVRLVPEIPERLGDLPPPLRSDPETERYRLFDAVAAWLSAASAEAPVVLVVDDLHWASQPTLSLLGHLTRSGEPLRLLVVASYRDTDLDLTAELADAVAELLRQPGVDRLHLTGLDEAGLVAFIEAQARHELDDTWRALARVLHAETAGNPFFVGQVLRHLGETGALVRRKGRWTPERPLDEVGIPEGVRDVIGQRLARLPDETRDTLALAAVVGDRFELDVLVRAAGEAELTTLRALDPAIAARLVTEAGSPAPGHRFVHALVRAALYEGLPTARRMELHRRAGDAIEAVHAAQVDDHLPALAHHFARAGRDRRSKAVDYATRAGDRALDQLAHQEAAGWYRQALDLLDHSAEAAARLERCDLLIALGEAERRAGDPAHRQTLLDAERLAQELTDPERFARAALANSRGIFSTWGKVDSERAEVLETALEALGPGDSALRARLLVTLAAELTWSPDREGRHRLVADAVAMARRLGDPATLGVVLVLGHYPIGDRFSPAELEERRTELAAIAGHRGDPALEFRVAEVGHLMALATGDLPAADLLLELMERLAEELGQPFLRWMATLYRSARSRTAGCFEEAEALAHEALELARAAGQPDGFHLFRGQLFWIRYDQGRLEELLDMVARGARREGALAMTRAMFCVALCELGRRDEARPVYDDLAASDLAAVHPWLSTHEMVAQVCADLDDAGRAALLYEELGPYHALHGTWGTATMDPVAHYLGLLATTLGRYDEAEAHFEEAARIDERIGAPAWLARTRLGWARMLVRRAGPGNAERAAELAGQALAAAEELGLARVAAKARPIITGDHLPAPPPTRRKGRGPGSSRR